MQPYVTQLNIFLANGEIKNESMFDSNLTLGIQERAQREENSGVPFPSINYYECPLCRTILHEKESTCPFCGIIANDVSFNITLITPKHEETFYALSGIGADIKILYSTATSGRWLIRSAPAITEKVYRSYRNSYFSATMDEYHLTHPIFSRTYYRSGNFLYSADKMCKGVVPFTDKFSLDFILMDPLTEIDVAYKYAFQLDNTVSYYKDNILSHKGTYKRKGNIIMVDMVDVNTGENDKRFLGIYRNQLCLETYVDPDGYMKYIMNMTNPFT